MVSILNDVIKHLLSSGTVPTHVVFLNDVVCVNTLDQAFGIWTIFSALLAQVKLGLQMETWLKPNSPFPNFLPRDDIQYYTRPYWNILSFTTNVMKKSNKLQTQKSCSQLFLKRQHGSNELVCFSIFSIKAWF